MVSLLDGMKRCLLFLVLFSSLCSFTQTKGKSGPGPVVATPVNKTLLLKLVNDARKKGRKCGDTYYAPAPELSWNEQLESAARVHSNDMYSKNYFSHTAPDGSGTADRMEQAGYTWKLYGENIGMGYQDEKQVVDGWLNSPGHCKNIMNPGFKEMAIARQGNYWTQVFGRR